MTENYYRTGRFNVDHSTFGGYVSDYDFNGYTSMKDIADRIESDLRFDKQCRKNAESRDKYSKPQERSNNRGAN